MVETVKHGAVEGSGGRGVRGNAEDVARTMNEGVEKAGSNFTQTRLTIDDNIKYTLRLKR